MTNFNDSVCSSQFSSANITPIFKSESRNHKDNYRSFIILSAVSKIFGKNMKRQLAIYFEKNIENISKRFQYPKLSRFVA